MISLQDDYKLDFSDVLLVPRVAKTDISSRSQVDLTVEGAVPIIVANMDYIGTFEVAGVLKSFGLLTALVKDYGPEEYEQAVRDLDLDPALLVPTLGTRDLDQEIAKIKDILGLFPQIPFVCLDVANGYLQASARAVNQLKNALGDVRVAAGNVVDEDGLALLSSAGADIVKVGIGSGGVCLTRRMTGVGYPQFSAIHDMREFASALGVDLISDGGMTDPGAAAKAFAAGARYVMAGSYFAGHEETGFEFHGMSSSQSRRHRGESVLGYRASEGREVVLRNRGSLAHTVSELLGGLRSACTLLGVEKLEHLASAEIQAVRVHHQLNKIAGTSGEG